MPQLRDGSDAAGDLLRRPGRGARRTRCAAPRRKEEFIAWLKGSGGFVYAGFCGDRRVEAEIKERTKATMRVSCRIRSSASPEAPTRCVWTGRPATGEAVWAGRTSAADGRVRPLSRGGWNTAHEGCSVANAASVGTPVYVYDAAMIRARYAS